jgi:hypothetical protein
MMSNTEIFKKLFNIQAEVGRLKKDKMNPHFKSSYIDINSVLDELIPLASEHKVFISQPTSVENGINYLKTIAVDIDSGESHEAIMVLPLNLDAQKTGSALTYYRRYMLVSMFGLQTVDDDGKAGSSPVAEKKKASDELVQELESLFNNLENKDAFRTQWLNYLGVVDFKDAPERAIKNAINQIKGGN